MTREDAIEELTPLNMAAHDALGVHLREEGYACAPHWLCCSERAKGKGLGLLYGRFAADGLTKAQVDDAVLDRFSGSGNLSDWRDREIIAYDAREASRIQFERTAGA